MKKLIFKAVLMISIMIGISNYLMYIMTGKAPFELKKPSLSFSSPSLDVPKVLPNREKAYKWVDENGVVHYSSEPPTEGLQAEVIEVDPNTNLVQATKLPQEEETENKPAEPTLPSGNVYNPETIKKLMDDAKNVQETLNKRYEDLEKH